MGRSGRAPPRRLFRQVGQDDRQHAPATPTQASKKHIASAIHGRQHQTHQPHRHAGGPRDLHGDKDAGVTSKA